jgi:putative ABC transport system permease protein
VLRTALRDLQWRRRRFAIGVIGAALVFGMTLVITGMSHGFDVEAAASVASLRTNGWVVAKGASGPFVGSRPLPTAALVFVENQPGVRLAVPTVFTVSEIIAGHNVTAVAVFGATPGTLGMPAVAEGRQPTANDDIAVSTKLAGYPLGAHLVLGDRRFVVVGKVDDASVLGGTPNVYLSLAAAQSVAFASQPVASAFAVRGSLPARLPLGLTAVDHAAAQDDIERPLRQAQSSIGLFAVILWIVAAMIVGSVIYISALERQRDFAVFKATGVSTRSIAWGLVIQALALSLIAAVIGCGVAALLAPFIPMPVSISVEAYLLLPVIGAVVGGVASLLALRRAVTVDPALAFGGP